MEQTSCETDKQSVDDILSFVDSTPEEFRENIRKYLTEQTALPFDEKTETDKAESWLAWARPLKYLKSVEVPVPDFVLPKHCSGELIDVKVFTKRGPDDQVYDTYKAVRERVARGNCFFRFTKGKRKGAICVLYGLKKFTGGLGDDDDRDKGDNFTWKKYFTKPLESTTKLIATRKANGEAAHLSCIEIDGEQLICAGSKNVHMLIRNRGDIAFYRGDRYKIAAEICHCIMDALDEMEPDKRQRLLKFLIATRYTAIFEILAPDHQHIEDLSCLKKPIMQFITWTHTELEPKAEDKMGTVPPHLGIEIARALGLKTIEYTVLKPSDVHDRMKEIRQGYNYEGEVLYFLDEDDNVIGLLKKKTVWYILCRAVREKARNAAADLIKNRSQFSISKCINRTEKRMSDIQSWLGLSNESLAKWKSLAAAFLKWCMNKIETGEKSREDIADKFPVIWKEHLEESGLSDRIEVECPADDADLESDEAMAASGYS